LFDLDEKQRDDERRVFWGNSEFDEAEGGVKKGEGQEVADRKDFLFSRMAKEKR